MIMPTISINSNDMLITSRDDDNELSEDDIDENDDGHGSNTYKILLRLFYYY